MARLGAPLLLLAALLARAGGAAAQSCTTAVSTLTAAVAAGGACADGGAGNAATSCSTACIAAVAGYVTGCGAAQLVDANVFALLELGKGLSQSSNAACRGAFLTQAQAFVTAPNNTDVCSNAVLYLGGAIENYGVCPTTGAAFTGACPANCAALLSGMAGWCPPTAVVRLPQLALQYKGIACTQPLCAVGTASLAVVAAEAQLSLPSACTGSGAPPPASGARAGARHAAALAAAVAAALALA